MTAVQSLLPVIRALGGVRLLAHLPKALVPTKMKATIFGFPTTLNLREGIQRTMFMGTYERPQTEWFRRCILPGDVVVDVGASFGHYTALAASLVGSGGKVYAFEPSPMPSATIAKMVENSGAKQIILTRAALGAQKGAVDLLLPSKDSALHTPSIFASDPAFTAHRIEVMTLDDFAEEKKIGRIKLIKIDVEGYEPDVLVGMNRLFAERRVENIVIEFNSGWLEKNGTTPEELEKKIEALGFDVKEKTAVQDGLLDGMTFTLQDVWFALKN